MFTGIIQAVGQIRSITPREEDVQLHIETGILNMQDVQLGDSIAVNGVCLTVIEYGQHWFNVHVSKETLRCTTGLNEMGSVNLEKALRFSDRLGGHLVSGHVDGIGRVTHFEPIGECYTLMIEAPSDLARYIAVKGSITVDGVSLTVNQVNHRVFSINLIPHTLECTTFQDCAVGDRVNLEVDLIARYVERINQWQTESPDDASDREH